jgi:hypothetical protein
MICVGKLFLFLSLEGNEVIPYGLFVLSWSQDFIISYHDAKCASYKVYTTIQQPCINPIYGDTKSSKRNQNPSRYYNSKTNLKFQHKPKYHRSKILI